MDEAGEIVGISIPFTLGIALGAAAGDCGWALRASLAGAAGIILPCLLAFAAGRRCSRAAVGAIFATAGVFCSLTHSMLPSPDGVGALQALAARALVRLRQAIGALEFEHPDTGALICALLTGDRSALGAADIESFRAAGASHILALSGLHLGVIYMIVSKILALLGNSVAARRIRSCTIVLFSGFYTLMTGAGPSIVRAFLFILLNEACRLSPEREHSPVRVLLIALTVQLALDPGVISSVGFQLSYLAMCGIVTLFPMMDAWYPEGRGPVRKLWQSTAMTVSCQVFTAPLAWLRFHTFPRYFIITNLVALPLTSAIMTLAVACVLLSSLSICPGVLPVLVDRLVQALLFCLRVIAGM